MEFQKKRGQFVKLYYEAVKQSFTDAKLFEDARQVLITLKAKGVKLVIVTSAYRWYIDSMISQFKINHFIDLVISNDDIKNPKPDPEAVFKACKELLISPQECLVVGDSGSDMKMASTAGSNSALMHPKNYDLFYSLEELKKTNPNHIIQSLSELITLV